MTDRNINDGPWAWQSKAALHRIREIAGESDKPSPASVIAAYVSLCELASDEHAVQFEASRPKIAQKAGVHVKTLDPALRLLEKAGLIRIEKRKIDETTNLPSIYTLLSCGGEIKLPPGEIKPPLGIRHDSVTTSPLYKNLEESEESIAPKGARVAKLKKPRERDAHMDALASLGGSDPAQVTGKAWGGIATALKEIREVCPQVTPEEIRRRAGHYRQHMPHAMLTALALAKHWATCDHPPQARPVSSQPNRHYPIPP